MRDGEWVIEPRFERTWLFSHGLAAVMRGGKWGYIDRSGAMVIAPQFREASSFDPHFAQVVLDSGAQVYIDRRGAVAFHHRDQGADGLFAIRTEGFHAWDAKWGYRDIATGELVIESRFAQAGKFFGEYATAGIWVPDVGRRHGMIDRSGAWVIQPTYLLENGMHERGAIFVIKDETTPDVYLHGIVAPDGTIVEPFENRYIRPDTSRYETKSAGPTAEDRALVRTEAQVPVQGAPGDVGKFPFRFYNHGASDSESCLVYRVRPVDAADVPKASKFMKDELLRDTGDGTITRDGGFFAITIYCSDLGGAFVDEQAEVSLRALHEVHPIAEVVSLRISDVADSEWSRWSIRQQEEPDDGPRFGW